MKKLILFFVLVSTGLEMFSQPFPIPSTHEEYAQYNRILAERYSPNFQQQIEIDGSDDLGLRDLIVKMNFDGNWNMSGNWAAMNTLIATLDEDDLATTEAIRPYIYYSVTWLNNHWVITYSYYHPQDWTSCIDLGFDEHENDMEGAIVYVSRDDYTIDHVTTIFHNDIKVDHNPVTWDGLNEHVVISVDNGAHSAAPYGQNNNIGCEGAHDFVITYEYAGTPNSASLDYPSKKGYYELIDITDIDQLWDNRFNPIVTTSEGHSREHQIIGHHAGLNKATPPWSWSQIDLLTPCMFEAFHIGGNFFTHDQIPSESVIEYNPFETGCGIIQNAPAASEGFTVQFDPKCGLPSNERRKIVIDKNTLWVGSDIERRNIEILSGNELIIQNSDFRISGTITVHSGAKLIIDNSILDYCGVEGYWEGIRTPYISEEPPAEIHIINGSEIWNAKRGISNSGYITGVNDIEFIGDANIIIDDSEFINNKMPLFLNGFVDVSITVTKSNFINNSDPSFLLALEDDFVAFEENIFKGVSDTHLYINGVNEVKITDCDFENETSCITLWESYGVQVEKCKFTGLENNGSHGILSTDSYASVINDNIFANFTFAIKTEGTTTGFGGMEIGQVTTPKNRFIGNSTAIYATGNTHPLGLKITNNLISQSNQTWQSASIALAGENNVDIINNTIRSSIYGLISNANGDYSNYYDCNEFQDNIKGDQYFSGENSKSRFIENLYQSPNAYTNVYMFGEADILNLQAKGLNDAAANCFTKNGVDDVSGNESTISFNYGYFDDSVSENCQRPESSNTIYDTEEMDISIGYCPVGIGALPFTSDQDEDEFSFDIEVEQDCPFCFIDSIDYWANQIISTDGDNPYTSEQDGNPLIDNYAEYYFNEWIEYGLNKLTKSKEYDKIEQILEPLKKWKWQKRLYGIYVLQEKYNDANTLLLSLPENNLDQIYFKEVQKINLSRIKFNSAQSDENEASFEESFFNSYILSNTEKNKLIEVGTSNTTSSGYARSLYHLLTRETLPIEIQTPEEGIRNRNTQVVTEERILVYPNPVDDIVNIQCTKGMKLINVSLYNLNGLSVLSEKINTNDYSLNVTGFASGIYILETLNSENEINNFKLIIQ